MVQERDNRRSLRQAVGIALGFLVTLGLGDWLFAQISLPPVYGSTNECRQKCVQYAALPRTPDVVFIGSSYTYYGVSPRTVDAEAGRLLGREVFSFNLASSAASLLTESLTVRSMLNAGPAPRVVYLDVSPRGASTTRREWLVWGMRGLGDARDLPLTLIADWDMIWESLRMAAFRSNFQFHDARLIAQYALRGAPLVPRLKTEYDERGWARWTGGRRDDQAAWDVFRGTLALGVDGPAFAPDNINGRAIRRAVSELRAAGAMVRLLEIPRGTVAAPPGAEAEAAAYAAFLDALSADTGLQVVRAPDGLVTGTHFFDLVHLTPEGAELFSRWLATDVANALRDGRGD